MALDVRVLLTLLALCFVATAVVAPRQARALNLEGAPTPGSAMAGAVGSLILVTVAAVVGTRLATEAGLSAPFFEAVVGPGDVLPALGAQLRGAALPTGLATVGGLGLYYAVFRPRLDASDVLRLERVRLRMGLLARVLQGGIVEEVLYRWGLMTVLAWLGGLVLGQGSSAAMWVAILLAGLVFGLGHLPGAAVLGIRRTPALVGTAIVVNLWVGVICGWLFWRLGLLAAMWAHGLVHVIWALFDRRLYQRLEAAAQSSA